jgi:hypothetical protein
MVQGIALVAFINAGVLADMRSGQNLGLVASEKVRGPNRLAVCFRCSSRRRIHRLLGWRVAPKVAGHRGNGYGWRVSPDFGLRSCLTRLLAQHSALGRATPLMVLALALGSVSCQSFKAVSKCNKLLGTVNGSLELARELHSKPPSVENYKALSDILGRLEAELVEQTSADGDFERAAKGYAKQMRRVSREARNFSQALERLEKAQQAADAEQEKLIQEELKRIRERAGRLVEASVNDAKKFREACRPKG